MGPIYHALGLTGRRHPARGPFLYDPSVRVARHPAGRASALLAARGVPRRHHLRHEQRVRLRLPPRQHALQPRGARPARASLRHRRRGGLDPDRRGADAADHLGPDPAEARRRLYYKIDRIIPKLKRAATIVEGKLSEIEEQAEGDFIVDEKARAVVADRAGRRPLRAAAGRREPLRPRATSSCPPHPPGAPGPRPLPEGRGLHRQGRGGRRRRRVACGPRWSSSTSSPGGMMPGRRWSDGLHQAVEAKEGVRIERENQTLATITFQNYFRMYDKLAGMTGTAETEAEEFAKIYKLDVTVIPTNRHAAPRQLSRTWSTRPSARSSTPSVDEIAERHAKGQPVLVGTVSIEKSERLSKLLKKRGHPSPGPQREVPRARGRDRRPGGPGGHGHHRHQHGRARAPTSCSAATPTSWPRRS